MMNLLKKSTLTICLLATIPAATFAASQAVSPPASAATDDSKETIEFSFDGGFASELFAQLSDAFPDFQVVINSRAKGFYIPEFAARIKEPGTIVDLVCNMESWVRGDDGKRIKGILEFRDVNNELVYISFSAWSDSAWQAATFVEVISVQELLTSGMGVEEIFGTVEAGVDLKEGSLAERTVVRFHEATGVLFVKGTKAVNSMVAQTVEALKMSAQWRVSDAAIAAKEARIKSEALDSLEEVTKEAARMQQAKLEQLMKDHEALLEQERKGEEEANEDE